MTRLADHKALVMGASSPVGIGAAIAEALIEAGADVLISARREAPLAEVAEQLGCGHHTCDVTDDDSISTLFASIDETWGRLDTAVFATGLNHFTPIRDFDREKARLGGVAAHRHDHLVEQQAGALDDVDVAPSDRVE